MAQKMQISDFLANKYQKFLYQKKQKLQKKFLDNFLQIFTKKKFRV